MATMIVGIGFVCLGATCAILSGALVQREIAAVNKKLPAADQISYSFMYPGKMQNIKMQYRQFYPNGRLESWRSRFQIAMFAFLALAAIFLGFLK